VEGATRVYLERKTELMILKDNTRWFKYDRDDLCVNKSQFVPVIFEPPCNLATFSDKNSLTPF
jgi:hypothetical protein